MIYAYQGNLYKVPIAGELAMKFSGATESEKYKPVISETKANEQKNTGSNQTQEAPKTVSSSLTEEKKESFDERKLVQ